MEYLYNDMLPLTAADVVKVDSTWVVFFLLLVAAAGLCLSLAGRRKESGS